MVTLDQSLLQVRAYMRTVAKPGIAMFELVETLEEKVRTLIEVSLWVPNTLCKAGSSMLKLTAGGELHPKPET